MTVPSHVDRVFGSVLGRIDGDLLALAFENERVAYSVEEGGTLRRWDCAAGKQTDIRVLSDTESCWAFSSDAKRLVSGGDHLSVWDVASATLLGQLFEPAWIFSVAFSPDGRTIASGHADHDVRLWDAQTGKLIRRLTQHSNEVSAVAFNADGSVLASAGEDRLVVLWNVAAGEPIRTLEGHTDRIDALAFSGDGTRVASASWDTSVRVWATATGDLMAMLNGQGECVHAVLFSPDGRLLVCGDSESVVRTWDFSHLKVVREMRWHQGPVRHLAIHKDGRLLASGGSDRAIQFWDIHKGEPVIVDQGPRTQVRAIGVSAASEIGVLHASGRIAAWNADSGAPLTVIEPASKVSALAPNPLGGWALGCENGSITLRPRLDQADARTWPAHPLPVRMLAYNRQADLLASSSGVEGTVHLWTAAGEPALVIPNAVAGGAVESLAFHPSARLIAVAGIGAAGEEHSEQILIWDIDKREVIVRLPGGFLDLVFNPAGDVLAAASVDRAIVLWNWRQGSLAGELDMSGDSPTAVVFDPRGQFLAAAGEEGSLRFWDTTSWQLAGVLELEASIRDLAFAPDGTAILTGNGNSTCYWIDRERLSLPH